MVINSRQQIRYILLFRLFWLEYSNSHWNDLGPVKGEWFCLIRMVWLIWKALLRTVLRVLERVGSSQRGGYCGRLDWVLARDNKSIMPDIYGEEMLFKQPFNLLKLYNMSKSLSSLRLFFTFIFCCTIYWSACRWVLDLLFNERSDLVNEHSFYPLYAKMAILKALQWMF